MKKTILAISFFIISSFCKSQDTDSLFSVARKLGFNGERAKARELCIRALVKSPNYSDIRIFLGRLYTWDDKYDSGRVCFKETLSRDPKNIEAYSAWCDLELWSDNYTEALKVSEMALSIDSNNSDILLRKAKAYVNLKKYIEAREVMIYALKVNPKDPVLFEYSESIRRIIQKNKISFSYDHDEFNKTFTPWNLYSLAYTRGTKYLGSVIARVNYADRFSTTGNQYEIDLYPSVGKKMYMYLNAGYSDVSIFPNYKWSASIYRSIPRSFEIELGVRYLKFSSETWVYTASIGKYWKNFWFSLRPNFIPGAAGNSGSLNFTTRYYLGSADKYFGLVLGSGISADELRINRNDGTPNSYLLKSNRVRLSYQQALKRNFNVGIGAGISEEETSFSGFRTNYNLSFFIEKIF